MDFLNRFGEKVKLTRKSNGLTQQALAKKTGFDYRYIGFIEKGRINATIKTLLRLAQALDVHPCELMPSHTPDRGRTDIYRLGEREMMIFSVMRQLLRADLEKLRTWDRMIEKALGRRPR